MKKFFLTLCATFFIGASAFTFARIGENKLYPLYATLYDYRRLTPELFPKSETLKILSVWHDATYADALWVSLIQFIWDNVGNEKYLDFSHAILSNITALNPYFVRAYEIDLLFTPLVYADSKEDMTADERNKITRAIVHGDLWMSVLCDTAKLNAISALPYGVALWEREDLKNPCKSGMIPYYIGFHYSNDFEEGEKASYYYKIASMQDNAPEATKFLGPIALANTKDPIDAALSFLLIAKDGYDKEPYECTKLADLLIQEINSKRMTLEDAWIDELQAKHVTIKDPKTENLPDAYSSNNCYDNLERGVKQIYIAYISEKAKIAPEITDAKTLVQSWIIQKIPTIPSQAGFNVRKRDGRWMFRSY